MITPYVEFKDGHKEEIKILGVGEREIVFIHRDIIYCCVKENNGFYPVFYPGPNEDLSYHFESLCAIKDDLEAPTRFPNCPMCKSYNTTYPYCDMCIEGNKFEYAVESIKEESTMFGVSTSCLICGEPVPMENPCDCPKICEKCKEAVMFVRRATDDQKELRKNRLRWARDHHKLTHPDDDMSDWPNPDEKE